MCEKLDVFSVSRSVIESNLSSCVDKFDRDLTVAVRIWDVVAFDIRFEDLHHLCEYNSTKFYRQLENSLHLCFLLAVGV